MKKIIAIGLCLVVFAVSASAQQADGNRIRKERTERNGNINRAERSHLKRDAVRTHVVRKHASRDGKVTPRERRKIHKMRKHTRHDAFRFKHNHNRHHRRVI